MVLFIQELLLHWLGTALHMWQGPCQGWITTRLKTREIFQMKLVFWRPSGWASKAIVKVHWTGTVKNSSGDTVVTKLSKNDCNPGPGDGIGSVQNQFLVRQFREKTSDSFCKPLIFCKNINHKIWLIWARSELTKCQNLLLSLIN